ncbi:hypothetical protein FGO68_gene9506 [Halteria grandinella]|uniref:Uncharacterized protein n=1 Tax=Halteria grandinella TaxID=5974 RepID=A0A8J8P5N0_HALGN|nr:hypothetical protein FGO68_gene9506 [Halteria grandinella]
MIVMTLLLMGTLIRWGIHLKMPLGTWALGSYIQHLTHLHQQLFFLLLHFTIRKRKQTNQKRRKVCACEWNNRQSGTFSFDSSYSNIFQYQFLVAQISIRQEMIQISPNIDEVWNIWRFDCFSYILCFPFNMLHLPSNPWSYNFQEQKSVKTLEFLRQFWHND